MDWQVVAPQLVALTLGVLSILQGIRKEKADTVATYLEAVREDMEKLRDRLDNLEDYVELLETHISAMTILMNKAGIEAPERPLRHRTGRSKGE